MSQCHSSTWATISKVNVSHAHDIVTARSFPQQYKENTHAHTTRTHISILYMFQDQPHAALQMEHLFYLWLLPC